MRLSSISSQHNEKWSTLAAARAWLLTSAHLSHLLETEHSARKISFWYGARSRQEIFYADYFAALVAAHRNFRFELAHSSPLPEDE